MHSSRSFVFCHILDSLRSLRCNNHRIKLSAEHRKAIHWWIRLISVYNGVSLIPNQSWSALDSVFSTDACLTGCGGMTADEYFHASFPSGVLRHFSSIHHLKALAIVVDLTAQLPSSSASNGQENDAVFYDEQLSEDPMSEFVSLLVDEPDPVDDSDTSEESESDIELSTSSDGNHGFRP